MPDEGIGRVALLWRGDHEASDKATLRNKRLAPVFDALSNRGIVAEPAVYRDDVQAVVREQLLRLDGVLVWADPIGGGEDRSKLDVMLREVSSRGVWVSAHPDTILKMGTKEVLFRTKHLSWGTDTHLYATFSEFETQFASRLAAGQPRVLKQNRGNGGIGVWKVTPLVGDAAAVRIQHAAPRDDVTEEVSLEAFMDRCRSYFSGSGRLIDQPFVTRIAEGMVRAYVVQDEVVGFARQYPAVPPSGIEALRPETVLGLPAAKTMYRPSEPEFERLKIDLEREWIPALQEAVGVEHDELPLLWDADFLYGPRTDTGTDTYVLCEINVSAVSPFPDEAVEKLADAVHTRILSAR